MNVYKGLVHFIMTIPGRLLMSIFIFIFLTGAVPNRSQVADVQISRDAYAAGVKFYKEKDFESSLKNFEQALSYRPYHPGLMYTVAAVSALAGKPEKALAMLASVARMNVFYPVADDSDFASLKANAEFRKLVSGFEELRTRPSSNTVVAFTLPEKDLVTESVAFDSRTKTFYVSSVHKRKIVAMSRDGQLHDFVSPAQDGIWSVFSIRVDEKRNALWASSSAMKEMRDFSEDEAGLAGIFEFDLKSGKLRQKHILADDLDHVFGDFVLHSSGDVFISDSKANTVYRLDARTGRFDTVLPEGSFASLQGLAFTQDEEALFVADYAQGIFMINMKSGAVTRVVQPDDASLLGIDGLYVLGDELIVIQNGIRPHRVAGLRLSSDRTTVERVRIVTMNHPAIDDPTLGCVVGYDFYFVANSQWSAFDKEGTMVPVEEMKNPVILKTSLR